MPAALDDELRCLFVEMADCCIFGYFEEVVRGMDTSFSLLSGTALVENRAKLVPSKSLLFFALK